MAGTITHLSIADMICKELGDSFFHNLPLFYAGNIAPDAIHARDNYIREYKKVTHLTEGISGSDFTDPVKLGLFHKKLRKYIDKYYFSETEYQNLYLGYIVHLVTDELFNIHVRTRYVELMGNEGIKDTDHEFFRRLMRDIDFTDRLILKKYPFKHDVRKMLEGVGGYEIKDMIRAEEADKSRRWVIDMYFNGDDYEGTGLYYNYNDTLMFIEYCTETILNRFRYSPDFPKLFI